MPYQMNPQGLNALFSNNDPRNAAAIGSLYDQMQSADAMTMQDQSRQLAYDNANDPIKLRHSGLANDTLAAQLPGVGADSRMKVRKDSNEDILNHDVIKSWQGKYKTEEQARHVEQAMNAGNRIAQLGEDARYRPLGAAQRAKKAFAEVGAEWDDSWDKMSPEQLAKHLNDYGTAIQTTSSKLQTQLDLQRLKNQPQYYSADARVSAAEKSANKPAPPAKPENMSVWEARMRELTKSPDKAIAAQADAALRKHLEGKAYVGSASTGIRESGAVDIGKLDTGKLDTRGPQAPPAAPSQLPTTEAAPPAAPVKKGFKMDSPEAKSWLQRAQAANPGMSIQDIMQQGVKSGRLQ